MSYVKNKDLYEAYVAFKRDIKEAESNGEPLPPIPRFIAESFTKIATKLSHSYNFVNYPYRDEMIAEAVLKCVKKAYKFDPDASQNPFAYYMQTCWNEFLVVIKREQKETSIKAKMLRNTDMSVYAEHAQHDDEGGNAFVEFLKENDVYVDYIEQSKQNRAEKNSTGQLHPSLRHRNLTPYKKKEAVVTEVVPPVIDDDDIVDLWGSDE